MNTPVDWLWSQQKADNIWGIITSSPRVMPAHFTSNGEGQPQGSFCIQYADLSADDEFAMAYVAHRMGGGMLPSGPRDSAYVLRVGEDLMLVGYLTTREGAPEVEQELCRRLFECAEEQISRSALDLPGVPEFFAKCLWYGCQRATLGAMADPPYAEQQVAGWEAKDAEVATDAPERP